MITKALALVMQWIEQGVCNLIGFFSRPLSTTFGDRLQMSVANNKKRLIIAISVLVIGGSLTSIYLTNRTPTPQLNHKPFEALGEAVAAATAKLLQDKGDIVLVTFQAGKGTLSKALTIPPDSFRAALKSHAGINIVATETVAVDINQTLGPLSGLNASRLLELLHQHRRVHAVVSFVGVSANPGTTWPPPTERLPKLILAGSYTPAVGELLRNNFAQVAILPRIRPTAQAKQPVTSSDWFESYYSIVTTENLSDLPTYGPPLPLK